MEKCSKVSKNLYHDTRYKMENEIGKYAVSEIGKYAVSEIGKYAVSE